MAPIIRVTVSSLINKARIPTRSRSLKFTIIFSKTLTSYTYADYPPPPPSMTPINLEKSNLNNSVDFSCQKNNRKCLEDYPPARATGLNGVQGCYMYHDLRLQQKKKKGYPEQQQQQQQQQQESLSHDQHAAIHIVIHAVIRTTIGTYLIGCAGTSVE